MNDIVVENLNKKYGDRQVIKDFNCRFFRGEFNGITGSSGIGKTSLLNILMGLDDDYEGNISNLDGNISVVFQENRLLENYSILENINLVLDQDIDITSLKEKLLALGLDGDPTIKVAKLSGGMKRRVAILRALVKEADLYIMDEPFKDMDPETHNLVLNFVASELRGKTLIFTSHRTEDLDLLDAHKINIKK